MREGQLWLLNIYSAILTVSFLGSWLLVLSKYLDYLLRKPLAIESLPQSLSEIDLHVIIFVIVLILGLVFIAVNRARRMITLSIRKRLIVGYLNHFDLESFVIAKILEKKKDNDEETK